MPSGRRSLIGGACLAIVLATPGQLLAIESDTSNSELRPLVSEARELVAVARQQTADLDMRLSRPAATSGQSAQYGGGGARPSDSYEYSELKRSVTRLVEIGNEVLDLASRCGADSRKIGVDFRTRTRKLSSSLSRVGSSSMDFARMTLTNVEKDLDAVEQQLQAVSTLPDCSGSDGSDEDDAGKSG
jgi:hypothetical protein